MAALPDAVRAFLERQPVGVLATRTAAGSVRQSLVYHLLEGNRVLISTEAARGKARDVERDGWASYCVMGHEAPWSSVTVEGRARVCTTGIADATTRLATKIRGEAPANELTDELLAAVGRVIIEIEIDRVYGASYLEEST